jgi:hypothetical protein
MNTSHAQQRWFILEDDVNRILAFEEILDGRHLTVVQSVADALKAFDPPYDGICLDHDLAEQHYQLYAEGDSTLELMGDTGLAFARWLAQHYVGHPDQVIVVHSWNPAGSQRMYEALRYTGCTVLVWPYDASLLVAIKHGLGVFGDTPEEQP